MPISVDTFRAEVAERALKAGAAMINDVWGLRADRQMAQVVARHNAAVVIMHNQVAPCYADLINEVKGFLQTSVHLALEAGISRDKIVVDPGFGFGKTAGHNLTMLRRLAELRDLSLPLLVARRARVPSARYWIYRLQNVWKERLPQSRWPLQAAVIWCEYMTCWP